MHIEPDDREALLAAERAWIAPTWEQQQAPRTIGRSGSSQASSRVLLGERVRLDHARLGLGQLEEAASAIVSPPSPQARGTRTSRRELAPADVALVLGPDGDRRQRAAVGTAGAQAAHADNLLPHGPLEEDRVAVDAHTCSLVQPGRAGDARCVDAERAARQATLAETH